MYIILNRKNLKFLYPNPILFITFILLFTPSVYPFDNRLSINEFTIYGNQFFIVSAASSISLIPYFRVYISILTPFYIVQI